MKKEYFSISSFLTALLLSCGVASAAESVMVAVADDTQSAVVAKNAEESVLVASNATQTEAAVAAEQIGEIQYVEVGSRLNFSGNIMTSWMDGFMNKEGLRRHRSQVDQLWFTAERALDTETYGVDWGFRVDAMFGMENAQFVDPQFDGKWGESGDGYATSIYQAYTEVGVNNFSVKVGKFGTILGYESVDISEGLYNTRSYMYEAEPYAHFGGIATWDATDKFALSFGITTGADTSWDAPNDELGFLFGTTYQITDRLSIGYAAMWNTLEDGGADVDEFLQTVTLSWDITDRFNYTFVTNYGNMNETLGDVSCELENQVGIGNYFTYVLTDKISLGMRYEWYKVEDGTEESEMKDLSMGVVYKPIENVIIRPELRYDWVDESVEGKKDGYTAGLGFGLVF